MRISYCFTCTCFTSFLTGLRSVSLGFPVGFILLKYILKKVGFQTTQFLPVPVSYINRNTSIYVYYVLRFLLYCFFRINLI